MCVGRLSREKRPDLALSTLRALLSRGVDARLSFAGSGPMRGELSRDAAGLPVAFLGHISDRARLSSIIADADVALAPCPAETFGLSVLEALASGTPAVTADRGAAMELIDSSCGRAAAVDAESMATAVLEVVALPEAERRGAARRRAESFPWTATVSAMLQAHALPRRHLTGAA